MEINISVVEWLLGATVSVTSFLVYNITRLNLRTSALEKQMDAHMAECAENKKTLTDIQVSVAFIEGELRHAACFEKRED